MRGRLGATSTPTLPVVDLAKAVEFYLQAIQSGDSEARAALDSLIARLRQEAEAGGPAAAEARSILSSLP